jgi:nicotinamidase-related amidase
MNNTGLLLLNIQNDYFQNGKMTLEKSLEASVKTQSIVKICREKKFLIVHVQHISTDPNATYLLPCTKGAEFHANVMPLKGETIIKKHYPNSFKDTQLLDRLKSNKITNLLICGMTTHLTVDSTVRAAHDFGFTNTIIQDACAAHPLEFNQTHISAQNVHSAFLAALQPIYATVVSADEYLQKIASRLQASEAVA